VEFPEVPKAVLTRLRKACLALPEALESAVEPGVEFRIRRRTFARVFSMVGPDGRCATMLVCRADPDEREVLRNIGHPFFIPRSGADRIGVVLDASTDWSEIGELVTESYRILAPKKLAALLDAGA